MRLTPLVLLLLVGCGWEKTTAPAEIACSGTITPPAFHYVAGNDTAFYTNRWTVPHRLADTVFLKAIPGQSPAVDIIVSHPGHCTTLSDSLIMWGDATKLIR